MVAFFNEWHVSCHDELLHSFLTVNLAGCSRALTPYDVSAMNPLCLAGSKGPDSVASQVFDHLHSSPGQSLRLLR